MDGAKRVGFVSTRFRGTDGVSLETAKWAQVLEQDGHQSYWLAGQLDTPEDRSLHVPEAFFEHPAIVAINQQIFGRTRRSRDCSAAIHTLSELIKDRLYAFVERFGIELLVAENCLTIPMHLALGIALTQVIAELRLPTIAHHHDFFWERDRFAVNAVPDYLAMAFPPPMSGVQHVVINSAAREQLAHRRGLSSMIVPNVLDFSTPPAAPSAAAAAEFRRYIGLEEQDIVIMQPTRVVARKGIEHAIELVRRLDDPRCKLVVTHESGDEGGDYQEFLTDYAASVGVDMRFVGQKISARHAPALAGESDRYTLWDVYPFADLVTYPSLYEGFGNAFLEAIYFRKPLLVNRYSIYIRDIEPRGFRVIRMDGYLTRSVVELTRKVLTDAELRREMVDTNFELGQRFYSYAVLERRLRHAFSNMFGLDPDY